MIEQQSVYVGPGTMITVLGTILALLVALLTRLTGLEWSLPVALLAPLLLGLVIDRTNQSPATAPLRIDSGVTYVLDDGSTVRVSITRLAEDN
jgi:hypothetical protein